MHPVSLGDPLGNEFALEPTPVTEFPKPLFGDKTAFQKPTEEQFGDPFTVLLVGFVPGYMLDMPGIDQDNPEIFFQNIEDRLPVYPRALHGDMGD